MAYSIMQQGDTVEYGVKQLVVNTKDDVSQVPTKDCKPGSTIFCIEDSSVWMLTIEDDNAPEWKEI